MKTYTNLFVFFGYLLSLILNAQSPGGVNSGLYFWFDPSSGITTGTGNSIQSWTNKISGLNLSNGSASRPVLNAATSQKNYNPYVSVSSNQLMWTNVITPAFGTNISMFISTRLTTSFVPSSMIFFNNTTDSETHNQGLGSYGTNPTQNPNLHFISGGGANINASITSISTLNDKMYILGSRTRSGGGTDAKSISLNGTNNSFTDNITQNLANNRFLFGQATYGNTGDISEIIVYQREISDNERQRVNSYLAIKNGVTLNHNYLSSSSALVYDISSIYKNNISGIGRDDNSALYQKQSNSINSGNQVLIGVGTPTTANATNTGTLSDGQFLIWGDNGLSKSFDSNLSGISGLNVRMSNVWKVQNTNSVGTVRILWESGISNLTLLKNVSDPTFSSGNTTVNMSSNTQTIGGTTYNYADVSFANGEYFTFAGSILSPGGVIGFDFWSKSDDAGTISTSWKDHSVNNNPIENVGGITLNPADSSHNFHPFTTGYSSTKYFREAVSSFAPTSVYTQRSISLFSAVKPNSLSNGRIVGIDNDNLFAAEPSLSMTSTGKVHFYKYTGVPLEQNYDSSNILSSGNSSLAYWSANNTTKALIVGKDGLENNFTFGGTLGTYGSIMMIGHGTWNNAGSFPGDIMEVIWYNKIMTTNEIDRVNSYLAIKNGVTFAKDYLSSSSVTTWDRTLNSGYNNNISGIGRDDNSALYQKQSNSINSGNQVLIGVDVPTTANATNTGTLNNGQFLIWGDNGLSKSFDSNLSGISGLNVRMSNVWKVQNTNSVGTVRILWESGISNLTLLKNVSDPTFSSGNTTVNMSSNTQTIGGTTYNYADVSFANGEYFTFASYLSGPGGVYSGLNLWYKADSKVYSDSGTTLATDNTNVTQWNNSNDILIYNLNQPNNIYKPKYYNTDSAKLINFNPTLYFNNNSIYNNSSSFMANNSAYSFISVALDESTDTAYRLVFQASKTINNFDLYKGGVPDLTNKTGWFNYRNGFNYLNINTHSFSNNLGTNTYNNGASNVNNSVHTKVLRPQIIGLSSNANTSLSSYIDNLKGIQTISNNITNLFNGFRIGAEADNIEVWKGRIPEVISYSTQLSDSDMLRVNSYLAIKYGITLGTGGNLANLNKNSNSSDYINSNYETVWDTTLNSNYNNNISGIGRDDLGNLYQKQSKSVNAGNQVLIGLGTFAQTNLTNTGTLNNGQFLIWGDNGLSKSVNIPISGIPDVTHRMGTVWKVQNTNSVGTVRVLWIEEIPKITLIKNTTDPTFTSGNTFIPMEINTILIGGTYYNYADVSFTNGEYFTFGGLDYCFKAAITGTPTSSGSGAYISSSNLDESEILNIPNSYLTLVSKSKGLVITRMTTAQINAITQPVEGMITYDTNVNCIKLYNGLIWKCLQKTCNK